MLYGALGFYFLPRATFQGDLTRVGLLPESEFGWQHKQPQLESQHFLQSPINEADVLVIGDSFSLSLVWQTILTKNNLKVHTEHWDNIEGVCIDFMDWLQRKQFKGKFIIFESIERGLVSNLDRSISCNAVQYKTNGLSIAEGQRGAPPTFFDIHAKDYSGKLSTGIRTQLNMMMYLLASLSDNFKAMSIANDVRLNRVANGCDIFSHKSCNDSLFLSKDDPAEIDQSALEKIKRLNSRLSGVIPIWAIVPNKSTSYLYSQKQFWNNLEQQTPAPNLLGMTEAAIKAKVIDLYPANNTHFSTTGYLLMGEAIYKTMSNTPQTKIGTLHY